MARPLRQGTLDFLREADDICTQFLMSENLYATVWQMPVVLVPLEKGGKPVIVLRPVVSSEAMTARFATLPFPLLDQLWDRLKAAGVGALLYDITHKPPGNHRVGMSGACALLSGQGKEPPVSQNNKTKTTKVEKEKAILVGVATKDVTRSQAKRAYGRAGPPGRHGRGRGGGNHHAAPRDPGPGHPGGRRQGGGNRGHGGRAIRPTW